MWAAGCTGRMRLTDRKRKTRLKQESLCSCPSSFSVSFSSQKAQTLDEQILHRGTAYGLEWQSLRVVLLFFPEAMPSSTLCSSTDISCIDTMQGRMQVVCTKGNGAFGHSAYKIRNLATTVWLSFIMHEFTSCENSLQYSGQLEKKGVKSPMRRICKSNFADSKR